MAEHRSIGKKISFISRSMGRYIDAKTRHLELGNFTIPFLTYLFENNGVHQDVLAEALLFDKSSAARAVALLEKRGYVTKTPDPENGRKNIIRTTPKAGAVRAELHGILKKTTRELFAGFSKTEIETYFDLSFRIHENAVNMVKEIK
ncbi:MarR family winged helix-turn-helix transcriptional regulator [Desulfospira joergensenii]|uniref:MarR family winged helix-turn-helix transcriptional regulator n=1 Tax=Desulfospira joergensenii TaxID=53329 RepID=UPI0003B582F9|nr:MarR family transcriptional regulator [Desulfospira joergensenii]